MANEHHLMLRIGSVFSGEGMQKLMNTTKSVNAQMRQAAGVSGQLASALGGMDTSAARAMAAVGGLVQSFAQGGVMGAAMAVTMTVINARMDEMKKKCDEVKKRSDELGKSVDAAFSRTVADGVKRVTEEAKSLSVEYERLAKHAQSVMGAMEGVRASGAKGGIIALETQKLNDTLAEADAQARAVTAASYDLEIAEARAADAYESATAKVEIANDAYIANQRRLTVIDEQVAVLTARRAEYEAAQANIRERDAAKAREVGKAIADIDKQIADLETRRRDVIADSTALELKYNQSEQDRRNAVAEHANAIRAATKSLQDAIDAQEEARDAALSGIADLGAEMEKDQLKTDREAANKELTAATKAEAEARRKSTEAATALEKAQKEYKDALKKYEESFGANRINEALADIIGNRGNRLGNTHNALIGGIGGISSEAGGVAARTAIREGTARTVDQAQKVADAAAREARRQASSAETAQWIRESERADRLRGRSAISRADRDWLAKYDEVAAGRDAQRKALAEAEQTRAEAERKAREAADAVIETGKRVKDISTTLESIETSLTEATTVG